jgi:peptide/nickel transport system substrate-binding protein
MTEVGPMRSTRRNALLGTIALPLAAVARGAGAQRPAREVRVGFTQDALTLDPANHRNRETQTIIRNIHDGLVARAPDMRVVPEIAESFRVVDAATYEFRIREGIRFHSGDVLSVEDVKFSLDRLTKPNAMGGATSPRRDLLGPLEETAIVDARTVRLRLARPWAPMLGLIPSQEIVNARHVGRVGQQAMQTATGGAARR